MEYLETRFHLKEKGTDIRTEVMAGITTFMAMAYILMVNASMFSELDGVTYGAIYIATAISAIIGTTAIGLLANLPLAQASAMGFNEIVQKGSSLLFFPERLDMAMVAALAERLKGRVMVSAGAKP